MKILFLDIDDVILSNRCKYLEHTRTQWHNETFPDHWVTFDPFVVQFLNHLFNCNDDLYAVLHSTWRKFYDEQTIAKHFISQGCEFRWHNDMFTPPIERWDSIRSWVHDHNLSANDYAILEDEKPPYSMKTRTIRVDEFNGFSHKNCERLIALLHLSKIDFNLKTQKETF